MTNEDVIVTILSETLGREEEIYRQILQIAKTMGNGKHRLDEELTDMEAERLLTALRKEKSGILNWAIDGWYEIHGSPLWSGRAR